MEDATSTHHSYNIDYKNGEVEERKKHTPRAKRQNIYN